MDTSETDPYEQQLLAVFESCDVCHRGSLDRIELQRLCELLPLDTEQTTNLMDYLLDRPEGRVTFLQFRDGLLTLLGGGVGSPVPHSSPEKFREDVKFTITREESPEREVSPKLVLGQKKYGRRSRPESSEHDAEFEIHSDSDDDVYLKPVKSMNNNCLEGPRVPGIPCFDDDVDAHNPKKRRTAEGVESFSQDVTKFPGESSNMHGPLGSLSQEEECLRSAWQQYGKDGYVNQRELALVCECIGGEKLSQEAIQQLFEQLDVDRDGKISLEEFLHLFRSGGNWTSPTASAPASQASSSVGRWTPIAPSSAGPLAGSIPDTHSGGASLSLMECNGMGMASPEAVIEMWDSVGVIDGARLFRDLVVDETRHVNITYLAGLIEDEVRQARTVSTPGAATPPVCPGPVTSSNNLLQAALSLRQAELKWLRSSMEQMACERDKLKSDLTDANHRASLLAQEIDEHHSKLEKFSQNQVKLLEHKHAEAIRDMSDRLSQEREQLVQQNCHLEHQVVALQQSEAKLTSEVASLRSENESLDRETRGLTEQLSEFEDTKLRMEKELQEMANLQQRLNELEGSREIDQVQPLIERINELQSENSTLRDRNDELTVELEVLSSRLANLRVKRQGPSSGTEATIGSGTKRRGNSPLTIPPTDDSGDEESPRMGKVRRCSHRGEISLDAVHIEGLQIHPLGNGESGVEADLDVDDSENLSAGSFERLGSGKLTLDHEWMQNPSETSSVVGSQDDLIHLSSSTCHGDTILTSVCTHLRARIKELEHALEKALERTGNNDTRRSDLQGLKEVEEGAILMCDQDTPSSSLEAVNGHWSEKVTPLAKIAETQTSINESDVSGPSGQVVEELQQHCKDLESQLDNVKIEIVKILSEKRACSQENCILKKRISDLCNHLPADGSTTNNLIEEKADLCSTSSCQSGTETPPNVVSTECSLIAVKEDKEVNTECTETINTVIESTVDWDKKLREIEETHANTVASLGDRCAELEKSLSLMRDEYERCEDYWAGKLDEERHLAEQEQRITDEKFAELLSKIREYEELFADDARRMFNCNDRRLETIEEKDGLEKQVTDLEEELEEFRQHAEIQIAEKDAEVKQLRDQLQGLQNGYTSLSGCGTDVAVQVSDLETGSWGSDRTYVVKPHITSTENHNENGVVSDNILSSTPSTSSNSDSPVQRSDEDKREKCSGAVRHHQHQSRNRRMRHHPHYVALNCLSPQDELQAAGLRFREQEQACIRLQRALRIQQQQTQALLQHTWERHKQEVSDLQNVLQCTHEKLEQQSQLCRDQIERLTRSDILVKDLYVENAHLSAAIQNLEQRCHLLMQQHASITSSDNCSSV